MKVLKALGAIFCATMIFFGAQIFLALLSSVSLVFITIFAFSSMEGSPAILTDMLSDLLLSGTMNDYLMATVFFSNVLAATAIVSIAWGLSFVKDAPSATEMLSVRKFRPSSIPLLVIFGISLNALISIVWALIPFPESWISEYENAMVGMDEMTFLTFLAVAISAPLAEELVCRSVFLSSFRRFTPRWLAVILSSLLFGIMHGNLYQASYAFVGGVFLGVIFCRYDSVLPSMVVHFAFNAASFLFQLLLLLSEENVIGAFLSSVLLIFLALLTLPAFALILWTTKKVKRNIPHENGYTVMEDTFLKENIDEH